MTVLETTFAAARDHKRIAEIAAVLGRFGVDDIAIRLGLGGLLPKRRTRASHTDSESRSQPERLRLAIESLGPTFIKLGQILSTRADLLSPEWITELEKLQSDVAPEPWEAIRAQVEEDLGASPDTVFLSFAHTALAAGSIAQVHRATLQDGTDVVVKVRRAGLRPLVEADLRLLSHAAGLVEAQWPEFARYRPREILHHLGTAMGEELDLAAEGRNCEAVAQNLAAMERIKIPRIFSEWSSERLLVQEYIDGIVPNDHAALNAAGLDGRELARTGTTAFLRMALVDGLFHADPHPGNLRALPGNRVAFIDFGMVGRLGARRREQLLMLVAAIVETSGERVAALLMEWSGAADIDLPRLEAACDIFVARHGVPPLRLGEAITDFMALAREHDLALPADLALLFKALITADGVMRSLDPNFDALAVAGPIVQEEMIRRYRPGALMGKGKSLALDFAGLATEAPSLLRLLALRLRQGRIAAEVELKGLDRIGADIRWAATRIAVAIVTAAFALGLAPRLLDFGPTLLGIPVTALLGIAVILGGVAWLLVPRRR
ncbi:AarF/UbiB family protein [Aquamicrobium lusatiense]|uniref:ABC1 kinase family protein n=1 Tax=Aquamicrobium lusatiense TaxID=89772 RepID=UPI002458A054|nr:AarF/UbiB family protein [Aquamicrobium lusatiense]MDH4991659.1 AarF/UbiB family protein [Aquamicrobium lusatiense]